MIDFDCLADELVRQGVRTVLGIPGGGASLSLLDCLEKRGVGFCRTRFEGTGVLMAATMGRLSGKAGLSLSIKGPGLANAVPGLAAAWFEAFPVIHLTEAFPHSAPASKAHKRLDHESLVKGISKGFCALSPECDHLLQMFDLAESEEPGPVVLELAESSGFAAAPQKAETVTAKADSILESIKRSRNPVVIAGALAVRQRWSSRLNTLGIPVFSTAAAKGVVDETLSHSAGVFTGVGAELTPESVLLARADLVVALGLTAREVLEVKPSDREFVNMVAVRAPGYKGFSFAHTAGIEAVAEVFDALAEKSWGLVELERIKCRLQSQMVGDFLPGQVFLRIHEHFSGVARVVMDTGYFCTIGEHAWQARKPDWCLMSGQGRYMGTGLPMALGASLHDPSVPTLAFLGDGGVGMYPAEAGIAVRYKLPLLIILMSDNAFGSIRTRAIKDGLTQAPLIMDGERWASVFGAMGIPGVRVENIEEVADAVAAWDPEGGPAFMEIKFDPDKYESMIRGIR